MKDSTREAVAEMIEAALADRDRRDQANVLVLGVQVAIVAGGVVIAKRAVERRAIRKDRKNRKKDK